MLILTRKPGQSVMFGDDVIITILNSNKSQIKIGIEAPKEISVYREEITHEIKGNENFLKHSRCKSCVAPSNTKAISNYM